MTKRSKRFSSLLSLSPERVMGSHYLITINGHKYLYLDGIECMFQIFQVHDHLHAGIYFDPSKRDMFMLEDCVVTVDKTERDCGFYCGTAYFVVNEDDGKDNLIAVDLVSTESARQTLVAFRLFSEVPNNPLS